MYSYEQRANAVELLIQYDMSYATVMRELGYPSSTESLRGWYREYQKNGMIHKEYDKKDKYSDEDKQKAVNYYLEHGKCISRTCRKLGYPCRTVLKEWIEEIAPGQRKCCKKPSTTVILTPEEKKQAVIDLCSRTGSADEIAEKYGVSRCSLYAWKKELLPEGSFQKMAKEKADICNTSETVETLKNEVETLKEQAADLQQQVYRLQLEKDVLEKAAEILKKDQGIRLETITNREKAMVIDALRDRYLLKELLEVFHMAKSSYCYQANAIKAPDKYEDIREQIRTSFTESGGCYGYRRIYLSVTKPDGGRVSEKVIRHLMKDENLVVKIKKRRKYNSYKGEITPAVENIIERDFHADAPNTKWLTDITEFHIPAGKVYLSPIIDCFDGLPVSWTIGTSPDADLVNTMLDSAISTLKNDEKPIVHSDRGCHYRWPGWIERMEKADLTRSMSKKGCSPDNSACEGFFGRLKNEMFYNRTWEGVTIEEFIDILNTYIQWYSEKRIKVSLGGMSPMQYRRSLGLVA